MKVLYAADFVPDPNSGAAGTLLAVGRALADRGHDVDYLWKQPDPYWLPHSSLARWFELPRRQYRCVADRLERTAFDVVMISQPYAYLVFERLPAKYPGTLFLNITHGWEDRFNEARLRFAWDGPYSPLRRLGLRLAKSLVDRACRRTVRACHGLISPSRHSADYVRHKYDAPAEKVAVIPYGLDDRIRSAVRNGGATGDHMLYVGGYQPVKGSRVLEALLPSIAVAYPRASMTFVVPGDAIAAVRAHFEPVFGRRLSILPWRDRGDLISVYLRHDVLLVPSLFEGFGKTFLEGMACGACVVGFNEGGLPDIAVHGTDALYCEAGDVTALRALLEGCLRSPGLTSEIGQRAQQVARQYSWARTAVNVEAFCERRRAASGLASASRHALVR